MKIKNHSQFTICNSQIVEELIGMITVYFRHCFNFNNYFSFDEQI